MTRPETSLGSELATLLRLPRVYPEHPASVEVEETHISWVFLTERFAYKLKKPVRHDFLDFRTLDDRRHACELEVKLNRRLAPDVYLDAVPVTRESSGSVKLGGTGPAVDWVVKMRRLPVEHSLAYLIEHGTVTARDVANVARVIVDFYVLRPPLCVRPDQFRKHLAQQVSGNTQTLLASGGTPWEADLRSVYAAQCRFLALCPDVLDRRVCDGRIVDGHGDLRPEHIYLENPPVIIDCIEFNDQLRHLDVADELAFLAMECDRLGAEWVGRQIDGVYRQTSRDDPPQVLLDFYRSYRAVVRAKVASLRGAQLADADRAGAEASIRDYLRLARRYVGTLGAPVLLVVGGRMGTGKSTLAGSLSQWLGIDRLSTDEVRRELFGASQCPAAYEGGVYQSDLRETVYEHLFERAERLLREGQSVVLDGTFLTCQLRDRAMQLALRHRALPLFVACQCPRAVARARLARRLADGQSTSEARPEHYDHQACHEEPLSESLPAVCVDTTTALNLQLESVTKRLRAELSTAGMLAVPICP